MDVVKYVGSQNFTNFSKVVKIDGKNIFRPREKNEAFIFSADTLWSYSRDVPPRSKVPQAWPNLGEAALGERKAAPRRGRPAQEDGCAGERLGGVASLQWSAFELKMLDITFAEFPQNLC